MTIVSSIKLGNKEVLPIIEGGKGVGVSDGRSSGAFAAIGAVGTFSGVRAKLIDENGNYIPLTHTAKTRKERHEDLVSYSIKSGVRQAQIARDASGKHGCIHINILWEMGGAQRILHGIMSQAKDLINGITCGAGMPYKLAEIAATYSVYYYPIISSARAFKALWKRSYHKFSEWLGGVVYEDPWLAGGHNGISNSDDPNAPEKPEKRLLEIRQSMNEFGLQNTPIIMAGGIWWLSEWESIIDNKMLAPIAFQFGTRPLLTQESPIPDSWKQKLMTLKAGDVLVHRFSPTGLYSSAVHNPFLQNIIEKTERQIKFSRNPTDEQNVAFTPHGYRGALYVAEKDRQKAEHWAESGFLEALKTPDDTIIFVAPEQKKSIAKDQADCAGCLSHCKFSGWQETAPHTTGIKPDPRSFCIKKTLYNIVSFGDVENELMFAGHNVYRFATDPFYQNNFIPTVKQLVDRILSGK